MADPKPAKFTADGGKTTANVRTESELERDYLMESQWYMQGWTHFRIAEELNARFYSHNPLTRQQISYDIKKILKRWQDRADTNIGQRKAEELARIDKLEDEYWSAWERSKEAAKTITKRGEAVYQMLRDSDGDPRFLQGVERCIEMRIKILGLAAPTKTKVEFEGTNDELVSAIKVRLAGVGISLTGSETPQADGGDG